MVSPGRGRRWWRTVLVLAPDTSHPLRVPHGVIELCQPGASASTAGAALSGNVVLNPVFDGDDGSDDGKGIFTPVTNPAFEAVVDAIVPAAAAGEESLPPLPGAALPQAPTAAAAPLLPLLPGRWKQGDTVVYVGISYTHPSGKGGVQHGDVGTVLGLYPMSSESVMTPDQPGIEPEFQGDACPRVDCYFLNLSVPFGVHPESHTGPNTGPVPVMREIQTEAKYAKRFGAQAEQYPLMACCCCLLFCPVLCPFYAYALASDHSDKENGNEAGITSKLGRYGVLAEYVAGAQHASTDAPFAIFTEEQMLEMYEQAMSDEYINWDKKKPPTPPGLAESRDISKVMQLAQEQGMDGQLLTARKGVASAVFTLQCALCMAFGDSRTSNDAGVRPAGHPNLGGANHWLSASHPPMPGYEFGKLVIDAIIALKASPALAALGDLTTELTTRVFAAISGEMGAEIPTINTHPLQDMGLQSAPFAGNEYGTGIPMADCTAENTREINAAIAHLKSGAFGDPDDFDDNGRGDFCVVMTSWDPSWGIKRRPEITPLIYLIACGINRFESFHGKAAAAVAAVAGAKYSKGPVKNGKRVIAKCTVGGGYHSTDDAKKPNCMLVLDILRGTGTCTSHTMMLEVRAKAVDVFGQQPAVQKDRRRKPQRDMLLVFEVDGMYCELQLHYEQTLCIKSLMHARFEIDRLTTEDGWLMGLSAGSVFNSGLDNVMEFPLWGDRYSASDVKVLLHI